MMTHSCGRHFTSEHSYRAHLKSGCDGTRQQPTPRPNTRGKRFGLTIELGSLHASMLAELMEARGVKTCKGMVELLIEEETNA